MYRNVHALNKNFSRAEERKKPAYINYLKKNFVKAIKVDQIFNFPKKRTHGITEVNLRIILMLAITRTIPNILFRFKAETLAA